jgi:hypothetical protein
MQLVIVLFLAAALLSLGPNLAIDGRTTSIPLPFLVLDHLPLINDLLPIRISFEMDGLFAAIIAFGLDDLRRATGSDRSTRRHVRDRAAVVAAATLVIVVVTLLPRWPAGAAYAAPRAVSLPAALSRDIPTGDPLTLTYPYAVNNPLFKRFGTQPMVWQAQSGFRFRLLGGFAYHPTARGLPTLLPKSLRPGELTDFLMNSEGLSPGAGQLSAPEVTPALVEATRTALARYRVRLVLVDRSTPGSHAALDLFADALGPPQASIGRFTLWSPT